MSDRISRRYSPLLPPDTRMYLIERRSARCRCGRWPLAWILVTGEYAPGLLAQRLRVAKRTLDYIGPCRHGLSPVRYAIRRLMDLFRRWEP